jgi:hypothetical protein
MKRGSAVQNLVTTTNWRRSVRPRLILSAVEATKLTRWSPTLIETVLDELHVGDQCEQLLGSASRTLRVSQYPQAITLASILRHSWRPDDLAAISKRLRLKGLQA